MEYGRNIRDKKRGSSRRDSENDKEVKDSKGRSVESTVPCVALLVGVELPHRDNSSEAKEHVEHRNKRCKSIEEPVSGLSVGGFCRWRGCLCRGTKVSMVRLQFS